MIVRYNFLYKSVILKLLHKFSLRRKKNELRGKNKRKILSAAANSMCKLLPLPAQLIASNVHIQNNVSICFVFFLARNIKWMFSFGWVLLYTRIYGTQQKETEHRMTSNTSPSILYELSIPLIRVHCRVALKLKTIIISCVGLH